MSDHAFLCPECGSSQPKEIYFVSAVLDDTDPWSGILKRIVCAGCRMVIPAHLGELWEEMTPEKARHEWTRVFRNSSGRQRII